MRAAARLGVTAVVCAATGVLAPLPAHASGAFAGQWSATDHDGSHLTLSVQGGEGRYAVREVDDAATVCGGAPATVSGPGTADGSLLVVRATLACTPGGNAFRQRIELSFTYEPTPETLTDNDGVVWTRAG
jgi:hypothetical protein